MLMLWMLYAVLVTTTAALIALCVERALRILRQPTRYVWLLAMVAAVGFALFRPFVPEPDRASDQGPSVLATSNSAEGARAVVHPRASDGSKSERPALFARLTPAQDRAVSEALAALWALGSLAVGVVFSGTLVRLGRARRRWRASHLDGVAVRVSNGFGPAVVGLRRPDIVVPEWVADLDAGSRAMLLKHEVEHIRGGDPQIMAAAGLMLVIMPWNAPLWIMTARLRASIELDCDRRVLRSISVQNVRAYGVLLLEVAARARSGAGPAIALSASGSGLAQRISALKLAVPRFARARVAVHLAMAGAALSVAAAMPAPSLATASATAQPRPPAAAATTQRVDGERLVLPTSDVLRAHARRLEPTLFGPRPAPPTIIAMILDEDGRVTRHAVTPRSTDGYPVDRAIRELFPDIAGVDYKVGGIAEVRLPIRPKQPGEVLDAPVRGSVWVVWAMLRDTRGTAP